MVKDSRESSEPRSGFTSFAAGQSGTSRDLITFRSEATLSVNDLEVTYSDDGTTQATAEFYDDEEGTAEGDLSNQIDQYKIKPGDQLILEEIVRDDIENDLVVVVRDNDDVVDVVAGGFLTTG